MTIQADDIFLIMCEIFFSSLNFIWTLCENIFLCNFLYQFEFYLDMVSDDIC